MHGCLPAKQPVHGQDGCSHRSRGLVVCFKFHQPHNRRACSSQKPRHMRLADQLLEGPACRLSAALALASSYLLGPCPLGHHSLRRPTHGPRPCLTASRCCTMASSSKLVAFVSGAASGIGRATALAFAKAGCEVACADINSDGAMAIAKAIQGKWVAMGPGTPVTCCCLHGRNDLALHWWPTSFCSASRWL